MAETRPFSMSDSNWSTSWHPRMNHVRSSVLVVVQGQARQLRQILTRSASMTRSGRSPVTNVSADWTIRSAA